MLLQLLMMVPPLLSFVYSIFGPRCAWALQYHN